MTARIYSLSDAAAERARDARALAWEAYNARDFDTYSRLSSEARRLEDAASRSRPKVVAFRSQTSFAMEGGAA
jgi:hypothetical protein